MSRVFLVREIALNRAVVVKVLPAEMSAAVSLARFKREVQLAAQMQHPHIVPLLSSGETGGLPFFTMPFIEGESLRARLSREGELPIAEAIRILRDVASALAYAHARGVIHRDIKPENIMISGDSAVVTDFGVAKALADATGKDGDAALTSHGVALGTFAYMSPEQASADPAADHRADIYSLGVVGFEMLAGDPPFGRRTAEATIAAHMVEEPPLLTTRRSAVPPQLAGLIGKCLSKRPADRPQTAKALIESLDSIRSEEIPATSNAKRFRMGAAAIAAIALLLLVVAAIAWSVRRNTDGVTSSSAPGFKALAVLPFVNLGGNKQDEYFSDGMTDELSAALSKIPGLRIASRTSTFAVGGADRADLAEIGKRLHVDAVLEGRLRRDGNRLRLTAQLTNVSDGLAIWSESYEREVKDVFAVQDDISRSIAQALRVAMAPASLTHAPNQGTTDVQAYDLYLRGRYSWYHRDLPRAIAYLGSATARDPRFAGAFAALASSYVLLPEYVTNAPPDIAERARAAAARALELDSTQSEAWSALGLGYVHAWQWNRADSSYKRALALNPGDATAHQWMGELLYTLGRTDESVAEMRRAMELDPLAPVPALAYGYALYLDRQFKAGVTQGQRAVELAPRVGIAHARLAQEYLAVGDSAHALAEAKEAFDLDSGLASRAAFYGYVAGAVRDTLTARRMIRRLEQLPGSGQASPSAMFIAYLGIGDRERAFHFLEKAVEMRDIALGGAYPLVSDPIFDAVRHDPRFARTLAALRLGAP